MATDQAFTSWEAVEDRLRQLEQEKRGHADRVQEHLLALKDREHRGLLMKDAAHDLLHAWKPVEAVKAVLQSDSGIWPLLVQFLGMRGGFKRRLFWTALSMAMPLVMKHVDMSKVVGTLGGLLRSMRGDHQGTNGSVTEEQEDVEEQRP